MKSINIARAENLGRVSGGYRVSQELHLSVVITSGYSPDNNQPRASLHKTGAF
jgi:hypothetical protein